MKKETEGVVRTWDINFVLTVRHAARLSLQRDELDKIQ
tara:strand:- start:61345 stop:61458 length:114 start_codon:yes stop_codon:yes gene_type:complete